jgi:hypothetical protein
MFSCSNNFRPLLHVLNLKPEFWRIRLTDLILAEETDTLYRLRRIFIAAATLWRRKVPLQFACHVLSASERFVTLQFFLCFSNEIENFASFRFRTFLDFGST